MRKALLIGTALAALAGAPMMVASVALADTATTTTQLQVDAETLIGLNVINAEGETIGEIDNVVIDADGQVRHVIVGVGGFLGIGEKDVALNWSELVVAADGSSVTVPYTKDQLAALPDHAYPTDIERGTVYTYDQDLQANAYLTETKQAVVEAIEETKETVTETASEVADTVADVTTTGTVTTDAARIEASSLLGADVQTTSGESVGDVDEIWLDSSGQVAGLVVDVGGYLGIGSDPVLLAWSDLQIRHDGDDVVAVTPLTREQIEGLTSIQNSSN